MDRFKEIDAFVQVMAHGSLAAAALAEGVTHVMMGRRLDALEQRLGTQLAIRTTRRLTLTGQSRRQPGLQRWGTAAPLGERRPGAGLALHLGDSKTTAKR